VIQLRPARPADREAIIRLGVRTLDWEPDAREHAFFAWKHDHNPFGPSLSWVAVDGEEVVGFRTFMRWTVERDGQRMQLVRAVDTATSPDHQRQGIFRRLTLGALPELAAAGVAAVFNTPNPRSRPGYLAMGWSELGRPTLGVVPRDLPSLARIARSRPPAERWSEPVAIGEPAADVLAAWTSGHGLRPPPGWSTPRTPEYLAWRYSFEALNYRAIPVRGGICIFRVRRRGPSQEVALCEWLSDRADPRAVRHLARAGDYVLGTGLSLRRHGAIPLPRQGPVLVWRPLARPDPPPRRQLSLGLGDLELF
jgi:predicted N-acetyltransferase YhbS